MFVFSLSEVVYTIKLHAGHGKGYMQMELELLVIHYGRLHRCSGNASVLGDAAFKKVPASGQICNAACS
jgi:hypothetical protein